MKPTLPWHRTPLGRVVLFLGGVRFAVPVLLLVAAAMAWATYIESTQSARVAKATVYTSWWFVGLMGLIGVSLVLAVVTRYPWKRRHVGFITVHAGLVMLILGGFWSLFTRVEGHLTLEEGTSGDVMELDREVVELVEFNAGHAHTVAAASAPSGPGSLTLGPIKARVVEVWPNTREEPYVADDAAEPFRAVEVALSESDSHGEWVGEEARTGGPVTLGGLTVRVLAAGSGWEPPAGSVGGEAGFCFVAGGKRYPLGGMGDEAVPGWRIESLERFENAMVSGGRITERGGGQANPAVEVVIGDGKGTRERHTAFLNFPDMILVRTLEGTGASGARLTASGEGARRETLVVFGPAEAPRLGYVGPDGAGRELAWPSSLPGVVDLGARRVVILRHVTRARVASRFVEAPPASERRPALVLEVDGERLVAPWKGLAPLSGSSRALRYGPALVRLPFSVHLKDFRKRDYPGTDMAMAYESDVSVSTPRATDEAHTISMNHPYAYGPWKVYQSGFVGERISVFSVMKDPGLPLTYAGSVVLCVGIFITFFSRTLSWGHPGIPAASPARKEADHGPVDEARAAAGGAVVGSAVGVGV